MKQTPASYLFSNISNSSSMSKWAFGWTFGIFLLFYGALSGTVRFWDSLSGIVLVPAGSWVTVGGAFIAGASFIGHNRFRGSSDSSTFPNVSIAAVLTSFLTLFFSDWICRPYSLIKGPEIRGEIFLFSLIVFAVITKRVESKFFRIALISSCLILSLCFINAAQGRFLFSDDHSVVVYRLGLLKDHFPFIPFYNPLWNFGLDARDFFATGILNLFTIWSPLIYLFDVRTIYNLIIVGTLFGIGPGLVWLSARLEKFEEPIPSIAALLSLMTSLFWYRWSIKYGSMGFVTATLFVPFNFILIKRIVFSESLPRWSWYFGVLSISWMLCWSLTGGIFIPTCGFILFALPQLLVQKKVRTLFFSLAAINLPWILLFLSVSKVQTFVNLHTKTQPSAVSEIEHSDDDEIHSDTRSASDIDQKNRIQATSKIKGKVKRITAILLLEHAREFATPANAALLVFGFFGLFSLPTKRLTWFYFAHAIWLLTVGFILAPFFPQLELDRMLIVLGFILCLPAAIILTQLIELFRETRFRRWLISLPLAYCCVGVFSVGSIFYNRTLEKFTFVDSVYFDLSRALKENSHGGRAVFAGFVLHELDQGHLAPLMQEANVPMVASTLFHNLWRYTELVPVEFLQKGPAGFEEYFDIVNATVVVTHEKKWRTYFIKNPQTYSFVGQYGSFQVFRRNRVSNYFLKGAGEVTKQTSNQVELRMDTPTATVAFQYFPFLKASNGCKITPAGFPGDLTFLHLTECDISASEPVVIQARSGFSRLFS